MAQQKMITSVPFRYYVSLLKTYLTPQRFKVGLLILLLFVSIGLDILNPQLLGHFIDSVENHMAILIPIALLFIGLVVVNQFVTAFASYLSEDISWWATNALRADLALHCLNLDMSFHKVHTPGELIERVNGDIAMLANFSHALSSMYLVARSCSSASSRSRSWLIGASGCCSWLLLC